MSLRAIPSPEALADIALQAEYYTVKSGVRLGCGWSPQSEKIGGRPSCIAGDQVQVVNIPFEITRG